MIVVVKIKADGKKFFKKCVIRDRTFFEVDEHNKKISKNPIPLSEIEGVISLINNTFGVKNVTEWLEEAQNKLFWKSI
jgi:hypothetical protein